MAFIFAGGWLVVRAWRVQRYGSPNASAAARRATDKDRRSARTADKGARADPASGGGRRGKGKTAEVVAPSGRPRPDANKRYTPKAPPRKRPPPPAD